MIDIETLGTEPGCIVWEIGAMEFDLRTRATGRTFWETINVDDAKARGLVEELATRLWWDQRGGIQQAPPLCSTVEALDLLTHWIESVKPENIWAWGSHFDIPLIEAAYRTAKKSRAYPWKYHQVSDARTVWKLAFGDRRHGPRTHGALADVSAQIGDLCAAWERISTGENERIIRP